MIDVVTRSVSDDRLKKQDTQADFLHMLLLLVKRPMFFSNQNLKFDIYIYIYVLLDSVNKFNLAKLFTRSLTHPQRK